MTNKYIAQRYINKIITTELLQSAVAVSNPTVYQILK